MFQELKERVCAANLELVKHGLVVLTWGNASAITDDRKYVVIKPSGVDYGTMRAEHMTVVDIDGNIVEGDMKPSSDLLTHLELYRSFDGIKGVVHTHSKYATAIAQAEADLPCYGTTHADNFYGTIPCTRCLTDEEIGSGYEKNTGKVIVETFRTRSIDPEATPAALVCKHGPFAWGGSVEKAVENALVLDEVAHMAVIAKICSPDMQPAPQYLMDKHYYRKHGANAYYGQK